MGKVSSSQFYACPKDQRLLSMKGFELCLCLQIYARLHNAVAFGLNLNSGIYIMSNITYAKRF